VAGASGYAGALAAELISKHPSLELARVTARTDAGRPLNELYPRYGVDLVLEEPAAEDGADVDAAVEDVRALFAGAEELSADDVRDWVGEHRPSEDTRAVSRIALYSLPLVRVPDGGRWGFTPKSKFTDSRHWLDKDPRANAPALIRSYLAAFGPATVRDAQQFLGGGDWQDVFDRLELERFGKHYDLPDAPRPSEDVDAPVRFLPDFDSLMLAHADRSRVIADAHRRELTTKNLRVRPVVLVDGMVAGFWKLEKKKVVVEPVRKLARREQAAVDEEAARLAAFAA
jgi:hypothetical protein